jgi:hypothetical protein
LKDHVDRGPTNTEFSGEGLPVDQGRKRAAHASCSGWRHTVPASRSV